MDLQSAWDQARKRTEILRMRLKDLSSLEATVIPYIFLAESSVNQGDTVVRKGSVRIERPAIVLPDFSPQFEGFEFEQESGMNPDAVATLLIVRGIHFPSLKYHHQLASLNVMDGALSKSIITVQDQLQRAEDINTGLVVGSEEAWQFSVLLLVGAMIVRQADGDLRRILEEWRKRNQHNN